MNIIIIFIAFIAGALVGSGSGLIPPIEWIIDIGVPADKHLYLGLILIVVWLCWHIVVGGRILPARR